ncbi:unnamed protein product [Arabis nemorensis]|uniref:Uncharacterized protein n=1 Tax=Arabis nemorensis TaxID=586526 RepID=A0A565BVV9_9BRAS|nr:unnamed protein product [Arabis nemorensis]
MSSTENLRLLQEFDRHVEEVIFTADCTAWNDKRSSQILDGLLFIVKRTIEPRFQIILQPAWPVNTHADHCGFCMVESFNQVGRFEELKPRFLLPSQGFVVFFNNLEDSTRAAECIKGLVTNAPTGGTTQVTEEHRGSGVGDDPSITTNIRTNEIIEEQRDSEIRAGDDPSITTHIRTNEIIEEHRHSVISLDMLAASGATENNHPQVWDEKAYLQNTRVVMAMIAVLLATIVLSVGLNPPSSINTLAVVRSVKVYVHYVYYHKVFIQELIT